ncbi:prolipoprotein diacylglyceryl transferase [Enterococcus dispar]|uniref:Phosphatidylglycerol--prolipoprotein diacylglyceryl transferase n=1 Tax=Enterococcus dispar ATCC 51266 TaxID=1139219 RepID=S0KQK6_9ENTE|nr:MULTISPECIES: prolipoprotein diacylglyceryl transferase [Enterococcus]EGO8235373.1 prolipoprotein diacylglyceryl transferase [Enterococcus faecalis]EGO8740210.1 prolipoprotein diacylglyceryl transferase [Enterococcus faecalis]EGO9005217.1 prolipoprotein diacylglyceryl transferase [Enterococcus faecalis]EGO9161155.1 prolipoprotein diacylglyceryl transferase [Enterococcus faecalis]EOI31559.1 prolipoprotein diacylglyceryl transferase [Enterococcus faecalis EnGen0250]
MREPYNRVFISFGPFTIYWYAVFIVSGILLGYFIASKRAKKEGISEDVISDLLLYGLPVSIISARLYYVFFELDSYIRNPVDILKVWEGGLAIHGGLIGAVATGVIYCRKKNLSFWKVADIVAPSIVIGQIIGRWGNFMNQEAYGGEISREALKGFLLPNFIVNQMYIDGAYRQPTFLYESLWNIGVLIILILLIKRKAFNGQLFLVYIIMYSIGRFWIEGLRTDSLMLTQNLRMAQVLSISLIFSALLVYFYLKKNKEEHYNGNYT